MAPCSEEVVLADHILDLNDSVDPKSVEDHLSRCPRCATRIRELSLGRDLLASAITPVEPPPELGVRLLAHLRGKGRFQDLHPQLAELFDLPLPEVEALAQRIQAPSAWKEFPGVPGLSLMSVPGGAKVGGATRAVFRLRAGATFPGHRHEGEERSLILQGGLLENGSTECWAGESLHKRVGTQHSYRALEGPDCLVAVVLFGRFDFVEQAGS